jgi:hypothetical protein
MRPKKLTIFFEGIKNISGIIIALKYSQYAFTAVIELDPSFIPASGPVPERACNFVGARWIAFQGRPSRTAGKVAVSGAKGCQ